MITTWREAPHLYTERKRAALALTEEATGLDAHGASDEAWAVAARAAADRGGRTAPPPRRRPLE
jgi:alkylhydroperoxidase family enzyme